jgi:hypothetical protein
MGQVYGHDGLGDTGDEFADRGIDSDAVDMHSRGIC